MGARSAIFRPAATPGGRGIFRMAIAAAVASPRAALSEERVQIIE
jgi:hypothetical protein